MRHAPGDRQVTRRLILAACLLSSAIPAAHAQVGIEVSLDESEYILYEPITVRVRLTNHTAEALDLQRMAGDHPWLGFVVTTREEDEVEPTDQQWTPPKISLLAGQIRTVTANITPLFTLRESGQYRVAAQITLGGKTRVTRPARFTLVKGATIWEREFSAPSAPGSASKAARPRLYSLVVHRGEKGQLLYARILDPEAHRAYCTTPLGNIVNFGEPRARIDLKGNFHIFHQSGTRIFTYSTFNAQGKRLTVRYFSNIGSNPEMVVTDHDETEVVGGEEIIPGKDDIERTLPTAPPARDPAAPPPPTPKSILDNDD